MTNQEYRIGEETLLRALKTHQEQAIKTIMFHVEPAIAAPLLQRVFPSLPGEPAFSDPPEDWNDAHEDEFMPARVSRSVDVVEWRTPTSNRRIQISNHCYFQVDFGASRCAAGDLACLLEKAGIVFTAHTAGSGELVEDWTLGEVMRESPFATQLR